MLPFAFNTIKQRVPHLWTIFTDNLLAEQDFTSEINRHHIPVNIDERIYYCFCVSLFHNPAPGFDLFTRLGGWTGSHRVRNMKKIVSEMLIDRIGIDSHRLDLITKLNTACDEISNRLKAYHGIVSITSQEHLAGWNTNESFEDVFVRLSSHRIFHSRIKRYDFLEVLAKHNNFYLTPSLMHTPGSTGPIRGLAMVLLGTHLGYPTADDGHILTAQQINLTEWNANTNAAYHLNSLQSEKQKIYIIEKWLIAEAQTQFVADINNPEFNFALESTLCNFQKEDFFHSRQYPNLYQE